MKNTLTKLSAAVLFLALTTMSIRAQPAFAPYHPTAVDRAADIAQNAIPLVALALGIIAVVAIIGIFFYFRHRRNQMLHETLRAMMEKGLPITPELLAGFKVAETKDPDSQKRSNNDVRNGLVLVGAGIGVIVFAGKPGWIVFFVGIAFLISSLVSRKKNNQQPPKP